MKINSEKVGQIRKQIAELGDVLDLEEAEDGVVIEWRKADGFACRKSDGRLMVESENISYVFRALWHLQSCGGKDFEMRETFGLDMLGGMVDCSRNAVYTVDAVKRLIRYFAVMGYNCIELYTEDTYEIDDEPYFGHLRGRYAKAELKELSAYAASYGVELRPCIQALAHLGSLFQWPEYTQIHDVDDILLIGEERTYELIENMFRTLSECFVSRRVNIGFDEAMMMGYGMYTRKNGVPIRHEIMYKHLLRVLDIAAKYGFECEMWSDMFFRLAFGDYYGPDKTVPPEVTSIIPENVRLIYWDYYRTKAEDYELIMDKHLSLTDNLAFAGGAYTWLGVCPCNSFSIAALSAGIAACRHKGIRDVLVTMWGDNGGEGNVFSVLPSLAVAADCAYGICDGAEQAARFKALAGLDIEAFLLLEAADKIDGVHDVNVNNPSKYMLYNDCFRGKADSSVDVGWTRRFSETAAALRKYIRDPKWGYIFECVYELNRVLELKYDLGVLTRDAYLRGDTKALKKLIDTHYKPLENRLESFYGAFLREWSHDKKPHGFDIQDIRLGGLMRRVAHCRAVLEAYCEGRRARIEELEEPVLDFFGEGENHQKKLYSFGTYAVHVSVNPL